MNIPRKHHYIPAFYLRQWAGADRCVCEFKRVPGKIVTRRAFPEATGYLYGLYRIEGLQGPESQVFESTFLARVDTDASEALQKLVSGDQTSWNDNVRSAWARFILSLRYRNPETVADFKRHLKDVWTAGAPKMSADYAKRRHSADPDTFENFISQNGPGEPHKPALRLLQNSIDNPRVGETILRMHWSCLSVAGSSASLLTSDRPVDWPQGLNAGEAYIVMPVGPKVLFVAAHNDAYERHVTSTDPNAIVRDVNEAMVRYARKFVWGLDDRFSQFVQDCMSTAPDRPFITEEQKRAAINAMTGDGPGN